MLVTTSGGRDQENQGSKPARANSSQDSISKMLGKMPFSKKAHEKTHIHRAKFNGRPKLPGWPGKRWRSPESGRAVAFIEGGG
jgi:hypothetical protein